MRLANATVFALAVVLPPHNLGAGEQTARTATASDAAISAAVARFVTQHHSSGSAERPRLNFDTPEIHPQDQAGKYAVIGGYMAFGGDRPQPHAYGLTMRLTCPRQHDPDCWQLEKLLIDQNLVVDK